MSTSPIPALPFLTTPWRLVLRRVLARNVAALALLSVIMAANAASTPAQPTIIEAPASRSVAQGEPMRLTVVASGSPPFIYQWRKEGAALVSATGPRLEWTSVGPDDAGYYDVIVANRFGSVTSTVAALAINQAHADATRFDPRFVPGYGLAHALPALDGGVIAFDWRLSRFNPDGSLDHSFERRQPGLSATNNVTAAGIQADGAILVAGQVNAPSGTTPRPFLVRLFPDGSLDPSFRGDPSVAGWEFVTGVRVEAEGSILVAGGPHRGPPFFSQQSQDLLRLNADGSIDSRFKFNAAIEGELTAWAMQGDGQPLLAVASLDQPTSWLVRVRSNGSPDPAFHIDFPGPVTACLSLPSGGTLTAGGWGTLEWRDGLRRTLDSSAMAIDGAAWTLTAQADGAVLVGGRFQSLGGLSRTALARIRSDRRVDALFAPVALGGRWRFYSWDASAALSVDADGRILVGGEFTRVDQASGGTVVRLVNPTPASQELLVEPGAVIWRRGGSAPEVDFARFETSTDGVAWQPLGGGRRVADGWRWEGGPLPQGVRVRAHGWAPSGQGGFSGVIIQSVAGPASILQQPTPRDTFAGENAVLNVVAAGSGELRYAWFKDGVALMDQPEVKGSQSNRLVLHSVVHADAGVYSVVVSDGSSSVSSEAVRLDVTEPSLRSAATNQWVDVGSPFRLQVDVAGTPPIEYEWLKDGRLIPGAHESEYRVSDTTLADEGLYEAVVRTSFGSITGAVGRVQVRAARFTALAPVGSDAWMVVPNSIISYPDRTFLALGSTARRYYEDGMPATAAPEHFMLAPGFSLREVSAAAIGEDGTTYYAASLEFTNRAYCQLYRQAIGTDPEPLFPIPQAGNIQSIALQEDGRLLVGGSFTSLLRAVRIGVARLLPDGTADPEFKVAGVNRGTTPEVPALQIHPDGRILVGGSFDRLMDLPVPNLGRLLPDGTVDADFRPRPDNTVLSLELMPDGRLVVGGTFQKIAGETQPFLARLNSDGTLDRTFRPKLDAPVRALRLQVDGRLIALAAGSPGSPIRVNPDGSVDPHLGPTPGNVPAIQLEADGGLLVGLADSVSLFARLPADEPSDDELGRVGDRLRWTRKGCAPEILRARFDYSLDGVHWTSLGSASRAARGWELQGVALPAQAMVRARGYRSGGPNSWWVESRTGPPNMLLAPYPITIDFGSDAHFRAAADGSGPISYRWRKDGVELSDGPGVQGATAPVLEVLQVRPGDEGNYSVRVSNALGAIESSPAGLRIIDPILLSGPESVLVNEGESWRLEVKARGSDPLRFHWQKEGVALPGTDGSVFDRRTGTPTDSGTYTVVVASPFGARTSTVARVTVVPAAAAFRSEVTGAFALLAPQPDGSLVAGGTFANSLAEPTTGLVRLFPDGRRDPTWVAPQDNLGDSLVMLDDGGLLTSSPYVSTGGGGVAADMAGDGGPEMADGWPLNSRELASPIWRLRADGSRDHSFPVHTIDMRPVALQRDGRILVGRSSPWNPGLARLQPDGQLDLGFAGGRIAANVLSSVVALDADGGILALDSSGNLLRRLSSDGLQDHSFASDFWGTITCIEIQTHGQILVGGYRVVSPGIVEPCVARFNRDGTRDPTFQCAVKGQAGSMALQADGRIVLSFLSYDAAGAWRKGMARLLTDGSIDPQFTFPQNLLDSEWPASVVLARAGALLLGGGFTSPETRQGFLARIPNPTPATEALVWEGQQILWQRGGSSPEVGQVRLDASVNGRDWLPLGYGERVPGGWRLRGVGDERPCLVRARGYRASNGTSWFVENTIAVGGVFFLPPSPDATDDTPLITVAGPAGRPIVVESSFDLTGWQPILTNTVSEAVFSFRDASPENAMTRFYRARFK